MYLVGITGPIKHGKTSFAKALQTQELGSKHFESGDLVIELVEAWRKESPRPPEPGNLTEINNWLASLAPLIGQKLSVSCTPRQLAISEEAITSDPAMLQKLNQYLTAVKKEPNLATEPINESNKEKFRPLLQWIGAYLVNKVSKGAWYDEIVHRTVQAQLDGTKLCLVSGLRFVNDAAILRAAGATIVEITRPKQASVDIDDPTERQRQQIQADTVIINNGTLEELNACAHQFYRDLQSKQLRAEYQAKPAT